MIELHPDPPQEIRWLRLAVQQVVRPLPVLWIQDSSERWHTTQAHGTSRPPGRQRRGCMWLDIIPPLDRGATWIDVVAAGQSAEARATLPLRWK